MTKINSGYVGVGIGLILFVVSILFLFFNEQNFVNLVRLTDYAKKNAIELTYSTPSPANNNKLIQISGLVNSNQNLSDGIVSLPNTIALKRTTEIYQWQEIYNSNNQNYQYKKEWNSELTNSDFFEKPEFQNPKTYKYKPLEIYAKNIKLGHFYLSEDIVKKINSPIKLQQLPYNNKFKIYNGFYFTGKDYDNPDIGDEKLFYSYIPSGKKFSIIAKQSGNQLIPMNTKYGNLVIITDGIKNLNQILDEYQNNNSGNTWRIRGICLLLMFIGLNLILQPIANITDKVPILGEITQFTITLAIIVITIALGTIAIAFSWLAVRPEIAIPAIILAIFAIISLKKKKKIIISE